MINLRTLKPIDRDTIVKSIKKTHRVVSAEEGWPQCGIGAELIAIATEECFDDLDAAPERVTGAEVPMPYAANLEAAALPQVSIFLPPFILHTCSVCSTTVSDFAKWQFVLAVMQSNGAHRHLEVCSGQIFVCNWIAGY